MINYHYYYYYYYILYVILTIYLRSARFESLSPNIITSRTDASFNFLFLSFFFFSSSSSSFSFQSSYTYKFISLFSLRRKIKIISTRVRKGIRAKQLFEEREREREKKRKKRDRFIALGNIFPIPGGRSRRCPSS